MLLTLVVDFWLAVEAVKLLQAVLRLGFPIYLVIVVN
jgi:hypothetical protein